MKKEKIIYICAAIAVVITAIGVWYFFSSLADMYMGIPFNADY